jgi:hypothetical protein
MTTKVRGTMGETIPDSGPLVRLEGGALAERDRIIAEAKRENQQDTSTAPRN